MNVFTAAEPEMNTSPMIVCGGFDDDGGEGGRVKLRHSFGHESQRQIEEMKMIYDRNIL